MYRLNFYVPEENLQAVKEALFAVGAGKIGDYEKCCWQVAGSGQFLPMKNSNPTIGEQGKVENVKEYKVEMVCADDLVLQVTDALLKAHPYEEPAYDLVKVRTKENLK